MPYPSRIDLDEIVDLAAALIGERGVDSVSLNDVAAGLGVKTPSLYRYVDGRTDLLRRVNLRFLQGLMAALAAARASDDPALEQLVAVLAAYRAYARANANLYLMALASDVDELRPDEDLLVEMILPLQEAMAGIAGERNSLAALRGAFALVHGAMMLELSGQLRRGGDLEADFDRAARAYLRGWEAQSSTAPG